MSHEEQTDLRIRRTHKFLQEAMIELIVEKGFDAITVGDIADHAMINRATFYRHYQDKYDLVTKIFEETVNQLVENMRPFEKEAYQNKTAQPPAVWVLLFEHVAEHSQLYRAMLGRNGSPWFADRMREYIITLFLDAELLREKREGFGRPPYPAIPQELSALQLAHVLIGTIVWWLESEKDFTPKQIAGWFYRFAFYGYVSARGYNPPVIAWEE